MYLEALLDYLPPSKALDRLRAQKQLEDAKAERLAVHQWINDIPKTKVNAAMALHYGAFATWEETAQYLGGISCHGVKKACERYLLAEQQKAESGKGDAM